MASPEWGRFSAAFSDGWAGVSALARALHFPAKIMGIVFGVVAMISELGMALGPPVGGWLFDRFGGYGWVFVASSAIGVAAALRPRPVVLAAVS
jgi:MFS family permease